MYHLPKELQEIIYSFDSTYKEIFDKCLTQIKDASRKKFKIKHVGYRKVYFSKKRHFLKKNPNEIIWRSTPVSILGNYFLLFVYLDLVWGVEYKNLLQFRYGNSLTHNFC